MTDRPETQTILKEWRGDDAHFHPVVLVPTYNNAATLLDVLTRIQRVAVPIIVINDGATDDTHNILKEWATQPCEIAPTVVTHPENRGKAAALRTGFAWAQQAGYTHAVTMDSDGQLCPEEIPSLLRAAAAAPQALVLGRRSERTSGLPRSNLVGWYTSGLGLWVETGVVVHDSQCGLRVYPLRLFDTVTCWAGRFGFEAEVIARAVWAGTGIVDVPITCHYPLQDHRVSHFRPFIDGAKGFFMHWALAIRRLIPWPQPKAWGSGVGEPPGDFPPADDKGGHRASKTVARVPARRLTMWRRWANPMDYVRQVRASRLEQLNASSAIAYGMFMACMPFGLWAPLLVVYGSKRLHHNLWAALLGVSLIVPPIGPAIARASITLGHGLLHLRFPEFQGATPGTDGWPTVLRAFPLSWCLGGVLMGTVLHWVTIVVAFSAFRWISPDDATEFREENGLNH